MSQHIEAYRPARPTAAWWRVAAEVQTIVKAAEPATGYSATALLGVLGRLAVFADGRGLPAGAESWLDAETIEAFVASGCPTVSVRTRANYRSRLYRLREAVIGTQLPGGPTAKLADTAVSVPYSRAAQADLWGAAAGQSTPRMREDLKILLALGLGCGLDSAEAIQVRTHDVRRTGPDGPVVVAVRGKRARLVVCRRDWESVLASAADRAQPGTWLFRPSATTRGKNTVTNFLGKCRAADGGLKLNMARARATWIVELINARVALPVLVAAAGVDSLHALSKLLPHVAEVDADEAEQMLRGSS